MLRDGLTPGQPAMAGHVVATGRARPAPASTAATQLLERQCSTATIGFEGPTPPPDTGICYHIGSGGDVQWTLTGPSQPFDRRSDHASTRPLNAA